MPVPLVKRSPWVKERERNKDGTWRKKRSDTKRIHTKGHYRLVTRDKDGRFIGAEKWSPKTREENFDYYETLPGKLSLRLNEPDLGLMEDDKKDFVEPVEALMAEVKMLERQVDILMKDNAELRIKLKAWEREVEVNKVKKDA